MVQGPGEENYRDRRYRNDHVFNLINSRYLTLPETDRKVNNEHLKLVIEEIFIPLMREDELFNVLYNRIMYGGSFYKGTKYGRPEEFDLDFIIKLPLDYSKITIDANHNNYGYVKLKVDTSGKMNPKWELHSKVLSKWLTSKNHLDQNKFRAWMERIFTSAFGKLRRNSEGYEISHKGKTYIITHKKSGPAFTMIIKTPGGSPIDVDLVPCLEFEGVKLGNGYRTLKPDPRSRCEQINKIMVVAKPLSNNTDSNILWRLCFYEQEKRFLDGDVKPIIKMMKKFRDTQNWKSIASYYLETLFYHELYRLQQSNKPGEKERFLTAPKTYLFMFGLKKLKIAFETQNLPYFWHQNHNLIGKINEAELRNLLGRINNIIREIEAKIEEDRFILADKVLGPLEARKLREQNAQGNLSPIEAVSQNTEQLDKVVEHSSSRCTIS